MVVAFRDSQIQFDVRVVLHRFLQILRLQLIREERVSPSLIVIDRKNNPQSSMNERT